MKIVIITGASSGIGKEFVFQLDQACNDVDEIWAIGRSIKTAKLPLTKAKLVRLPLDLTDGDTIKFLKQKLETEAPKIKVLVNSAGFGKMGNFEDVPLDVQTKMLECNNVALMQMCHICIPYMAKGGYIINMASAAAFLPQMRFAVYAASKSFVLSFSRALSYELRDRNISVTAVCPGPVKTPFFNTAEETGYQLSIKKYFMSKAPMVVLYALYCARKRRQTSIYGVPMRCFQLISKLLPHQLILEIYNLMV